MRWEELRYCLIQLGHMEENIPIEKMEKKTTSPIIYNIENPLPGNKQLFKGKNKKAEQ